MVEIQSVPLAPQRASMSGRARLVVWWFAALVSVITLGAAHAAPERLGTAHPVPERSELTIGIGPGEWGTGGLAVIADHNGTFTEAGFSPLNQTTFTTAQLTVADFAAD